MGEGCAAPAPANRSQPPERLLNIIPPYPSVFIHCYVKFKPVPPHIVTPAEKLEFDGMTHLINGLNETQLKSLWVDKTTRNLLIEDPIVLRPVYEPESFGKLDESLAGYLVVTAWGLEASDELVMNPINN